MHFPEGDFRNTMDHVLILDMAIHAFDTERFIVGKDATTALCREWNPAGSWYAKDASAMAYFTMDDDVRFVYHGSWCPEGCSGSDWRIIGTEGSVCATGNQFRAERVVSTGGFRSEVETLEVPVPTLGEHELSHVGAVWDFVEAIKTGREPISPCRDNFKSLAMVHAAIAASESGGEEHVETL
jgi:predicted dehydrogenase